MSKRRIARLIGIAVISATALASPAFAAPVKPAPDLPMVNAERPTALTETRMIRERLFAARSVQPSQEEAQAEWQARYVRPCTKSGKRLVC